MIRTIPFWLLNHKFVFRTLYFFLNKIFEKHFQIKSPNFIHIYFPISLQILGDIQNPLPRPIVINRPQINTVIFIKLAASFFVIGLPKSNFVNSTGLLSVTSHSNNCDTLKKQMFSCIFTYFLAINKKGREGMMA
jgi:hypothetical protein